MTSENKSGTHFMMHTLNLITHISAGTIAMLIGIVVLMRRKGTIFHFKAGKVFVGLLAIVVFTGFIGWLFFRANAFLLMLTLLAGYNTYGGYRIVHLKESRATALDNLISVIALATGTFYCLWLMNSDTVWSPTVIYSTVGALAFVTVYDLIKNFFFHEQLKHWWLYEHIYKIVSAFGALLSAFAGNILPNYKPYSQVGPSALCIMLIIIFIFVQSRKRRQFAKVDLTVQKINSQ